MKLISSFMPPAGVKGDKSGNVAAQVSRKSEVISALSQKLPESRTQTPSEDRRV